MMDAQNSQKISDIISQALQTIGLREITSDQSTLCGEMLDHLSISDWVDLCSYLCLSLDSISDGYDLNDHKTRIGRAWEMGELVLPRTPELSALLKEIEEECTRTRLKDC